MTQTKNGDERAFSFLPINKRESKPRKRGITEIRGPYYTPMGSRYLQDILETMSNYVDSLKFAGGSFSLMPRQVIKKLIDLCHSHDVLCFNRRLYRTCVDSWIKGGRVVH